MKLLPFLILLIFVLFTPKSTQALSFDGSVFPPQCQIEGDILSSTIKEAYTGDIWIELSKPVRYVMEVRITDLKNPDEDNGYEKTCRDFYKKGKTADLSIPLTNAEKFGVPETQMHIAGTVWAGATENELRNYTLSEEQTDDTTPKWQIYIGLFIIVLLSGSVGFFGGRRTNKQKA